jgi:isocitrate dehydrogenase kinase/phosphatase
MLVAIKMRRVLEEDHAGLVGTQGWQAFQEKLMECRSR